jgi:hypothetical protein
MRPQTTESAFLWWGRCGVPLWRFLSFAGAGVCSESRVFVKKIFSGVQPQGRGLLLEFGREEVDDLAEGRGKAMGRREAVAGVFGESAMEEGREQRLDLFGERGRKRIK